MKKKYLTPNMTVVKIQHQGIICLSDVNSVSSNAELEYIGGGSGPARARSRIGVDWEEEW